MNILRLILPLLLLPASGFPAEVYIGVEGARASAKRAIGLSAFTPENPQRPDDAETGARLREVLRSDLLSSRYFDVIEGTDLPGEGAGAVEAWKTAGAAFLLSAKSAQAQDIATLSVKIVDTASGAALLERYYRQNTRFWRMLAHKAADDAVRQLTGRAGIAHTQIAFINDQTGAKELYLADYDGENARRATSYKALTLFPRFSPDGKQIAFTSYKGGNPDLFLYNLEKGSARAVSERQGLNVVGGFSPDGAKIAVTMSAQKNPNIFILTLADGKALRATSHFGVDSSPTFSPDGEQIAFVSDRAGNPQVHVQELSTGRVKRLTRLNWCDSPAWSPSGEWIAFTGRANPKDKMDVFLVDVTGGRIIQLTHGEGSNEDPSWSPDSRFLAFTSTRSGRRQVFVMDADGSAPHPLADVPGNSSTPSWGP
ncbi:MAG: PD40 domain-containing protein [Elusimicrobia bacterium]|nr:PD40 domain-containing protein [Elusimicrobiota bacterium]